MAVNPLLSRLGLGAGDRAVIVHADDVGMCQASLAAYVELLDAGIVSSASTMVPCPWFPATAAFCRSRPAGHVDLGVHLTLNCEWPGYRWRPISTCDPASGLVDADGYLPATVAAVHERGDPAAVQTELQAQVRRALEAGIDVTHVDSHMGTVFHAKFLPAYLQLAADYRVPVFLVRQDEAGLRALGVDAQSAALFSAMLAGLEAQGVPLLDHVAMLPLDQPNDREVHIRRVLAALPPGISYLIAHPAQDTPELRAIAPDWRCRVADYHALSGSSLRAHVRDCGLHVVGWRAIRDLERGP